MAESATPVLSLDPSVGHVIEHGFDRWSIANPDVQTATIIAAAVVLVAWMILHYGARITAARAVRPDRATSTEFAATLKVAADAIAEAERVSIEAGRHLEALVERFDSLTVRLDRILDERHDLPCRSISPHGPVSGTVCAAA